MPDEKAKSKKEIHKEKVEEFKKKVNKKEGITQKEFIEQIATRELLERDYNEDTIEVIFNSSPSTRRKIISHKPTPEQMTELMKLQTQALILETQPPNEKIMTSLTSIYEKFAELAAKLSEDKTLNKEFWFKRQETDSLNSFINSLMTVSMQGPLPESELKKFR